MSIQFGVVLIVFLMTTMIFATQFEASTNTRAMKYFIYGSHWFDVAVALFVVNIIVNTLRRRPYRFRHAGFLTVHTGVLIIVAGGLTTRYRGVDGTMPIPEGSEAKEISLPQNDLVVEAGGQVKAHETHYDVAPWETMHDDLYSVPGMPYLLQVDRYYPTGTVTDSLLDDPQHGTPTIRVAVSVRGGDPAAAWLRIGDPDHAAATQGDLRIRLAGAAEAESLRAVWAKSSGAGAAGHLRLFWRDGKSEMLDLPSQVGSLVPTSRPGVKVEVIKVFHSFVLTQGGPADARDSPDNPAVRFRLVGSSSEHEVHLAFTKFPEFRTDPPAGETWLASGGQWEPTEDAGAAKQIAIVHEAEGRWVPWTSWRDAADGAPLSTTENRALQGAGVTLRLLDETEHGVLSRVVVQTAKDIQNPVLHVRLVERGKGSDSEAPRRASLVDALRFRPDVRPVAVTPNDVWLFHGEPFRFDTPKGPINLEYRSRSIPLNFAIHLDDFREVQYPGISMAASFESHVTVHPPIGSPFPYDIHMNHPLIYGGYTFYQASFQRTPEREVTILSVAHDPGMQLSFVGYCILVSGLLLIFFVKPYLRKLDDRWARTRNAGG
ncbi:MAG: cytochrome c biogenesis protein ResB [bacterium]